MVLKVLSDTRKVNDDLDTNWNEENQQANLPRHLVCGKHVRGSRMAGFPTPDSSSK